MSKVIKQDRVVSSGDVVKIPDTLPPPMPFGEEEEALRAAETLADQSPKPAGKDPRASADEVSRKILQAARAEREKILDQANADAQRIREDAWNTGLDEAFSQKKAEIESCLCEVSTLLDQIQEDQKAYLKRYEEELKVLAVEVAERILVRNISTEDTVLAAMVSQAVASIKNADWISVEVSNRLPGLVSFLKAEMSARVGRIPVEVIASDLPEGGCIVRTPDGVIDASVQTQLKNLKTMFSKMD